MNLRLQEAFLQGLGEAAQLPLGLAVSGGGDSLAMLHLAVQAGLRVEVVTVDHGLRAGSADEAAEVARLCAGWSVPHSTRHWSGPQAVGNLQDQARRARRELIAAWAHERGLGVVALAHSSDDVAETFLMRLARGAGIDGLSRMSADWQEAGLRWLRPLLAVSRQALREHLVAAGLPWAEDPSNAHLRFDRVKARAALQSLAPLGLGAGRLAEVAGLLACARDALEAATDRAMAHLVRERAGALWIDARGLADLPQDIRRRVFLRVIGWIAPAPYAPRGAKVLRALDAVLAARPCTLAGVRFLPHQGAVVALRDMRSLAGVTSGQGMVWDAVWQMTGPALDGAVVRALMADGLAQIADWRALGLPRAVLLAGPSLWLGQRLVAAPLAGMSQEWDVLRSPDAAALLNSSLSH